MKTERRIESLRSTAQKYNPRKMDDFDRWYDRHTASNDPRPDTSYAALLVATPKTNVEDFVTASEQNDDWLINRWNGTGNPYETAAKQQNPYKAAQNLHDQYLLDFIEHAAPKGKRVSEEV